MEETQPVFSEKFSFDFREKNLCLQSLAILIYPVLGARNLIQDNFFARCKLFCK